MSADTVLLPLETFEFPSIELFGVKIHNLTMPEVIQRIETWFADEKKHYLTTPNVDHIVQLQKDVEFQEAYQGASLVIPDGMPVIWASRLLGIPLKERVTGSDLFPLVCGLAAREGRRLFLLGAKPGVAEIAARNLTGKFPGIQIAGWYSPPFGFENDLEENQKIVNLINESNSEILFVALGAPKQEKWVARYLSKVKAKVAFCVGAALDFEAGVLKRAPSWMQKMGFEWLWRLGQDPKRLWKRYLVEDMLFLKLFLRQWFQKIK